MSNLANAIYLASDFFKDKTDKGGRPYIEHCLYVMGAVRPHGEDAMIVGVLHDLIEDTSVDAEMLSNAGYSQDIIAAIESVTRIEGEDYLEEFIPRCANNPIGRLVKMADIKHNMDVTRLKGLRKKDFDRLAKYARAYEYLKQ